MSPNEGINDTTASTSAGRHNYSDKGSPSPVRLLPLFGASEYSNIRPSHSSSGRVSDKDS